MKRLVNNLLPLLGGAACLALALAGCAGAPGQAEHVTVYASGFARVHVHIAGNGTGGTATASPQTTVPVSVTP